MVPLGAVTETTADLDRRVADVEVEVVRRLKRVTRTKLVKLIYLIDERYYRLYGETLTGLSYRYDKYGPNACDNAIVKIGDSLVGFELTMTRETLADGTRYTYLSGKSPRFGPVLSDRAVGVVEDVLAEYGHLPLARLVAASKTTRPFSNGPAPGDILRMATLRGDAEARLAQIQAKVAAWPPIPDFEPAVE